VLKVIADKGAEVFLRLTVFSFGLKVGRVSEILGMVPSEAYEADEGPRRPLDRAGHAMWIHRDVSNSCSIEAKLLGLINHLVQREQFEELSIDSHFVVNVELKSQSGPWLVEVSSATILRAARANIDIVFDYASETSEGARIRTQGCLVSTLIVGEGSYQPVKEVVESHTAEGPVEMRLGEKFGLQIASGVPPNGSLALHLRAIKEKHLKLIQILRERFSQSLLVLACSQSPWVRVPLSNIDLIFAAQIGLPLKIVLFPGSRNSIDGELPLILGETGCRGALEQ
jgi:hypothetical protein